MKKIKKWEKIYHIILNTELQAGQESDPWEKGNKWSDPHDCLSSLLDHHTGRTCEQTELGICGGQGALVPFLGKDQRGELHWSVRDLQKACLLLQLSTGKHMHVSEVLTAREQSRSSCKAPINVMEKPHVTGIKQSSPTVLSLLL